MLFCVFLSPQKNQVQQPGFQYDIGFWKRHILHTTNWSFNPQGHDSRRIVLENPGLFQTVGISFTYKSGTGLGCEIALMTLWLSPWQLHISRDYSKNQPPVGVPHNLQRGGPGGVCHEAEARRPSDGRRLDHLIGDCVDLSQVVGSYYKLQWWNIMFVCYISRQNHQKLPEPQVYHFRRSVKKWYSSASCLCICIEDSSLEWINARWLSSSFLGSRIFFRTRSEKGNKNDIGNENYYFSLSCVRHF